MMKKSLILILAIAMSLSMVLAGCGEKKDADETPDKTNGDTADPLKVLLLINGNTGDLSFFDSAANGMKLIKEKYGDAVETKVTEMGFDETKWEPSLRDASEEDWDIIIVGTWNMEESLTEIALEYTDKKYIIFDTTVNYEDNDLPNVYSVTYKQNEGSFIAGVLAARITTSDMPLANEEKVIGFLGGFEGPVINDFLVGYIQGAQYIDEEVKVAVSYIGSFEDSAKGKEMALVQYNNGADIGYNVAGQAGLGQIEAAKEVNRYAIGVDSDQALEFKDKDPEKAELIATSVLKRVDNSLLRAIDKHIEGTLSYGQAESLGFKEEAIVLADNEFSDKLISDELKQELKEIEEKIINGEIEVKSAITMEQKELDELKDSVRP
ncbi:MAG: BMP family ABC transporter substrate-binding protein [Vallitalea sp.]|jgi:basic membrane protein A|nr:BMP family ABC transporter substrate-binding protein [Vallitalea sp.]